MHACRRRQGPANGLLLAGLVFGACGLAVWASFTHPFTTGAEIVTAIALTGMIAARVMRVFSSGATRTADGPRPAVAGVIPRLRISARHVPWIVLSVVTSAFELIEYLSVPRHAHPTLSSLSDELTSSHAGRGVLFSAWIVLGALIVGPYGRHGAPAHGSGSATGPAEP